MNKEQLKGFCSWLIDLADAHQTLANSKPDGGLDVCCLAASDSGIHLWCMDGFELCEITSGLGIQVQRVPFDDIRDRKYFYFAGQKFFWLQDKKETADAE